MKIAIIENSKIVNIAVYDEMPEGGILAEGAKIGDTYENGVFTSPAVAPVVPQSVTMRQARLALLYAGLLDTVQVAIVAAGPAAKIEWEYATEVKRSSGLVIAMATTPGMTDAEIDALFVQAATL